MANTPSLKASTRPDSFMTLSPVFPVGSQYPPTPAPSRETTPRPTVT